MAFQLCICNEGVQLQRGIWQSAVRCWTAWTTSRLRALRAVVARQAQAVPVHRPTRHGSSRASSCTERSPRALATYQLRLSRNNVPQHCAHALTCSLSTRHLVFRRLGVKLWGGEACCLASSAIRKRAFLHGLSLCDPLRGGEVVGNMGGRCALRVLQGGNLALQHLLYATGPHACCDSAQHGTAVTLLCVSHRQQTNIAGLPSA